MTKDIDIKETASLIESAASEFSNASQSFADICALFEAIAALAHHRPLAQRLASFGARTCEASASAYEEESAAFRAFGDMLAEQLRPVERKEAKHD